MIAARSSAPPASRGARRRTLEAADIAPLAVHIISSTALTGAAYDIDGGRHLAVAHDAL